MVFMIEWVLRGRAIAKCDRMGVQALAHPRGWDRFNQGCNGWLGRWVWVVAAAAAGISTSFLARAPYMNCGHTWQYPGCPPLESTPPVPVLRDRQRFCPSDRATVAAATSRQ